LGNSVGVVSGRVTDWQQETRGLLYVGDDYSAEAVCHDISSSKE